MIREYAVDPEVICENINTLQRFFSEFGADNGRVIGAVPHKWVREFQDGIRALRLPQMEKNRCFDKISKLNTYSVLHRDGLGLGDKSWLEKAQILNAIESFNGVLTRIVDTESNQYNYINMLEHFPERWEIEQTISVRRRASDISDTIFKSIYLAKQVNLVDTYFDPADDRYTNPLFEFIAKMEVGRYNPKKLKIHTSEAVNGKTRGDIILALENVVKPRLSEGFQVEVHLWQSDYLHDRFVITNNVGYSFGHGLDERAYQGALEVNINRLGETGRLNELRRYSVLAKRIGEPITVTGI